MSLIQWLRPMTKRSKTIKYPRPIASRQRSPHYRPQLEALEDRTLPSVSLTNVPQWVDQGPGPIQDNAQNDAGSNAWPVFDNGLSIQAQAGAVESIAVEPVTASDKSTHYIVYAGTVNGGVWRAGFVDSSGQWVGDITPDMLTVVQPPGIGPYLLGNPTQIQWRPMSDSQPSLAISSLALDPNDTSGNTLWAGTGSLSSDVGAGGSAIGLLKTTDGGETWSVLGQNELAGQNIVSVVPTKKTDPSTGKQIVLVADGAGVWRSNNGGLSFQKVITGNATDIIADPNNSQRFYAAVAGFGGTGQTGVFESDDGGQNWLEIDNGTSQMTAAGSIKVAAQFSGTQTTLFAVTADQNGNLTGPFEGNVKPSGAGIDSNGWTSMGTPPPTWPSGWGANNGTYFTAAADPSATRVFYFATFQSAIVRVDPDGTWTMLGKTLGLPPGTAVTGPGGPNNTTTHDDQRHIAFLGNSLLVANDGGIYGLENPTQVPKGRGVVPYVGDSGYDGRWVSLNANLRDSELYNAQYDPRNDQIFGGAQDDGTPFSEVRFGVRSWGMEPGGNSDGGPSAMGYDYQYYSQANFGNYFYDGTQLPAPPDGSNGWFTNFFIGAIRLGPIGASPVLPGQLMLQSTGTDSAGNSLAAGPRLFELNIIKQLGNLVVTNDVTPTGMTGQITDVTYGVNNPNAVYFGTNTGQVWYRSTAGATFTQAKNSSGQPTWKGANPVEIAVDPYDSQTAYVLDTNGVVWRTFDAGKNWDNNLTGDNKLTGYLSTLGPLDNKGNRTAFVGDTLTLCDQNPTAAGQGALVVGGFGAVYSLQLSKITAGWQSVGQGLPTVLVTDVHYVQPQDLLLLGTLGRGAWTMGNASAALLTPPLSDITVTDDDARQNRIVIDSVPGFPDALEILVNNRVEYSGPASNVASITVNEDSADDTVIVGNGSLPRISGSIFISNPAATTFLSVDDHLDPNGNNNIVLSSNSVSFSGYPSISWDGVIYLNVRAGTGGNNIEVLDTIPHGWTDLSSGAGSDTVTVAATSQTLDVHGAGSTTVKLTPDAQMRASLQGPLILDGGGTGDFTLDDSADSTATTYIINAASVRVGTLPSISYTGLHKLTVNTGTGVDVYNVESTVAGTPVTLTGAGFFDTFNVTPTNKELRLLQADLTINPGRVSSVILNDQNAARNGGPTTYWLSSTVFLPPNSYVPSHGLKLQSSTASGSIYVNGPGATLNGSSLDDTYNVESIPGPVSLNTGIGHNTVNICPTTQATMLLEGDVTINGGGKTDVVINDQTYSSFGPAVPATYTLASRLRLIGSQLRQALIVQNTNASGSVIIAGTGSVTLNGLRGNLLNRDDSLKDIYNVESTLADIPVTVNTGTSNDTVNIGSLTNTFDSILGTVEVDGAGGNTALNVNDQGTTTTQNWDVAGSFIDRYPFGGVRPAVPQITYHNVGTVTVTAGSAQDFIFTQSTAAGTITTVNGGGGNGDYFFVENFANSLDDIQGLLQTHDVNPYNLLVTDGGTRAKHDYTVTTGELQFRDGVPPITFDSDVAFVLDASAGGGAVNVPSFGGTGFAAIIVNSLDKVTLGSQAGQGLSGITSDVRVQALLGQTPQVILDDSANPSVNWRTFDLGSDPFFGYLVNIHTDPIRGRIGLLLDPAAPVTILGGNGVIPTNDVFRVHDFTNAPALKIDAGNGINTLDYAAYTGNITVDLPLGKATGFTGGIANIENVTGSHGNDILVGDGNANVLKGGTGRNLLIGGAGADQITGGPGDDILIGGYTDYDSNLTALDAIMSEWTGSAKYQVRIDDIMNNGLAVAGQTILLDKNHVHNDFASDTLTGNLGQDWFFRDPLKTGLDTISDQNDGGTTKETVTITK